MRNLWRPPHDKAFWAGAKARDNNKPISACPYTQHGIKISTDGHLVSTKHRGLERAWLDGWHQKNQQLKQGDDDVNENEKVIAVDLDGVLAMYDHWRGIDHIGVPLPGAVEFTKALAKLGRVMIFTTRCSAMVNAPMLGAGLVVRVRNWLDEHGFFYDEIWSEVGKPLYAVLIDDRAVHCNPQDDPGGAYEIAISQATILIADQDAKDADEKDEAPPEDMMRPAGEQTNLPPETETSLDVAPPS